MLELKNIHKTYSCGITGCKTAVNNVTLSVSPGELVGLFGENGAGKTTLMKCVLGLLRHDGQVLLDGGPVTTRNIARLSFATCEHSFFPALTPADHREFYRDHFGAFREKRFQGLMDFFQLPMNRAVRGFSTGQKNQFEVILALSKGADYILMDEPFAGNDVFNREDFYKVLLGILEPNETILLSTHLLEEVEHFVSRAVLLRQGKVIGDACTLDLEEQGRSLLDYVKETYRYEPDRVSRALERLTEEEEP